MILFRGYLSVEEAVVSKETDTRRDSGGEIIDVTKEQEGAKYSALGYPRVNRDFSRACSINDNPLVSVRKKAFDPAKYITSNAIVCQFCKESFMRNSIERFTEV